MIAAPSTVAPEQLKELHITPLAVHVQKSRGVHHFVLGIVLAIGMALISTGPATAQATVQTWGQPVYDPPTGFWITPSNHSGRFYGPTSPSANWSVAQWGIPQDLPPFYNGATGNRFAQVSVTGNGAYTLGQNRATMPCNKVYPSGKELVSEFDLLVSPNNRSAPAYPQAVRNISARLGTLTHIYHSISVEPLTVNILDATCPATRVTFITAMVLTNPVSHQTIFYQLRLGVAGKRAAQAAPLNRQVPFYQLRFEEMMSQMARKRGTEVEWRLMPPGWFFTGTNIQNGQAHTYGYGDNITSYGQPAATLGRWSIYHLDLLPRLISLIQDGAKYGLDQNLGDWVLSGTYHGEAAFGHIQAESCWRGFSLTVQ